MHAAIGGPRGNFGKRFWRPLLATTERERERGKGGRTYPKETFFLLIEAVGGAVGARPRFRSKWA